MSNCNVAYEIDVVICHEELENDPKNYVPEFMMAKNLKWYLMS
jgi:hypothetical protein